MNKFAQAILALLALSGIGTAMGKVFVWGDSVVNYGSYVPWGLWVSLYGFLVGLAAGATWFAFWLGYKNNSLRWIRIGFGSAAISLIGALAFIGLDLGKPLKGVMIFFSPSFSSPLAWASWGYVVFILAVTFIILKRINSVTSPVVILAVAASVLFISAEAWLFSGMIARPLWHSWTNVLSFITSAIVSGGALVYGVAYLFSPESLTRDGDGLRKTLVYAIIVQLVVELGHLALAADLPEAMAQLEDWKFWVLYVGIGSLGSLYLLMKPGTAALGSALVLLGIGFYKYDFVAYAFLKPSLNGLPEAFQHSRLSMNYTPSIVEWLVAIGLLAAVGLAISLLMPVFLNEDASSSVKIDSSAKA